MSTYKPLIATIEEVAGIAPSITAMRNPMESHHKSDSKHHGPLGFELGQNDAKLAAKLIMAGDVHGKFQRGIDAWIRLEMQVGFMIEWLTYREDRRGISGMDDLSTSSAMLSLLRGMSGAALAEAKQDGLADKIYIRHEKISYQTLRDMYRWRRKHRHPDWQIFCGIIETMPHFDTLIWPERIS